MSNLVLLNLLCILLDSLLYKVAHAVENARKLN